MLSSARSALRVSSKVTRVRYFALVQSFSTSRPALDLARVTLIGRLGADPTLRESSSGKAYYSYTIATATGAAPVDASGVRQSPPTSWHTIFAFNENTHAYLSKIGKGSTVYVEADLEMRPSNPASDGTALPDRVLLKHQRINVINRVKPANEDEAESE